MGILGKLTGSDKAAEEEFETPPCPHKAITPRWNNADEIGKKELATYVCESCGETMSYEEAREILEPSEPAATR
jgi:hypothetical protein